MLNCEFALNNLSFGFCSVNILLELIKRKIHVNLFPIANNVDVSCFNKLSENEIEKIRSFAQNAILKYSSDDPCLKLWHINGSSHSPSKKKALITFYELDSPTAHEINILRNQDVVFVTSRYTKEIFDDILTCYPKVVYVPLGFDDRHFYDLGKRAYPDHVISFSIFGKFEKRKHHAKAIQGWIKKFGNNPKYVLNLHIFNPFLTPEQNNQVMSQIMGGKRYWNVNVLPYVKTLGELNQGFNAADIVIDMSGGEGFSLPSFHCLGLGKHAVLHNCSAIADWANEKNAILVNPVGKEEIYDGMFFHKGQPFNQGNIFCWDEEEYLNALDLAAERFKLSPINTEGKKLQENYRWSNTVDILMGEIDQL